MQFLWTAKSKKIYCDHLFVLAQIGYIKVLHKRKNELPKKTLKQNQTIAPALKDIAKVYVWRIYMSPPFHFKGPM